MRSELEAWFVAAAGGGFAGWCGTTGPSGDAWQRLVGLNLGWLLLARRADCAVATAWHWPGSEALSSCKRQVTYTRPKFQA